MQTKAEILLKRMDRLYRNIYNLLSAFQLASEDNSQTIYAELTEEDGTVKQVPVNSFSQLKQEIARIDANFKNLTTAPSYAYSSDGTISQYNRVSFLSAEYIDNFNFDGSQCIVDENSTLEDFVYPLIKLPIEITTANILSKQMHVKVYDISSGWDFIQDHNSDLREIQIQQYKNEGYIDYKVFARDLDVVKNQVSYYGKFKCNTAVAKQNGIYTLELDDIRYYSKNSVGKHLTLKVNDVLANPATASRYIVQAINRATKTVDVICGSGITTPAAGMNLYYNEVLDDTVPTINLPIKPNKKLLVYVSAENDFNIAYPSQAIVIDTSTFQVIYNNKQYSIDAFFETFVTNFSDYIQNLIDSVIPYTLGVKPNQPTLDSNNFRIIPTYTPITLQVKQQITNLYQQKKAIEEAIISNTNQLNSLQASLETIRVQFVFDRKVYVDDNNRLVLRNNELNRNIIKYESEINTVATASSEGLLIPKRAALRKSIDLIDAQITSIQAQRTFIGQISPGRALTTEQQKFVGGTQLAKYEFTSDDLTNSEKILDLQKTTLTTAKTNYEEQIAEIDVTVSEFENRTTVPNLGGITIDAGRQQINDFNTEIANNLTTINSNTDKINSIRTSFINTQRETNIRIQSLKQRQKTLQQDLIDKVKEIDLLATNYNLRNFNPNYKVIGCWDYQEPIQGSDELFRTRNQYIIKYDIQYRYLATYASTDDLKDVIEYDIERAGDTRRVVFNNWMNADSNLLEKQLIDGVLVWDRMDDEDVNGQNINQCMLPIQRNQSIEIRVRAVSEVGYPTYPLKSDWSNPIRINFNDDTEVEDLIDLTKINDIINEINSDLTKFNIIGEINTNDILEHAANAIIEANKTYYHQGEYISSGHYDENEQILSVADMFTQLIQRIQAVEDKVKDVNKFIPIGNQLLLTREKLLATTANTNNSTQL